VSHPGFAGDSTTWEGWGHVEEIGELLSGLPSNRSPRTWHRACAKGPQLDAKGGSKRRHPAGTPSVESAEMRTLPAESRELRRANEILKLASAFFAAELDRPKRWSSDSPTDTRKQTGSSRSATSSRSWVADSPRPVITRHGSERNRRGAARCSVEGSDSQGVYDETYECYGARKMWLELRGKGIDEVSTWHVARSSG
jgi:hypothetical protein